MTMARVRGRLSWALVLSLMGLLAWPALARGDELGWAEQLAKRLYVPPSTGDFSGLTALLGELKDPAAQEILTEARRGRGLIVRATRDVRDGDLACVEFSFTGLRDFTKNEPGFGRMLVLRLQRHENAVGWQAIGVEGYRYLLTQRDALLRSLVACFNSKDLAACAALMKGITAPTNQGQWAAIGAAEVLAALQSPANIWAQITDNGLEAMVLIVVDTQPPRTLPLFIEARIGREAGLNFKLTGILPASAKMVPAVNLIAAIRLADGLLLARTVAQQEASPNSPPAWQAVSYLDWKGKESAEPPMASGALALQPMRQAELILPVKARADGKLVLIKPLDFSFASMGPGTRTLAEWLARLAPLKAAASDAECQVLLLALLEDAASAPIHLPAARWLLLPTVSGLGGRDGQAKFAEWEKRLTLPQVAREARSEILKELVRHGPAQAQALLERLLSDADLAEDARKHLRFVAPNHPRLAEAKLATRQDALNQAPTLSAEAALTFLGQQVQLAQDPVFMAEFVTKLAWDKMSYKENSTYNLYLLIMPALVKSESERKKLAATMTADPLYAAVVSLNLVKVDLDEGRELLVMSLKAHAKDPSSLPLHQIVVPYLCQKRDRDGLKLTQDYLVAIPEIFGKYANTAMRALLQDLGQKVEQEFGTVAECQAWLATQ